MNTATFHYASASVGHTLFVKMLSLLSFAWVKPAIAHVSYALSVRAAERQLQHLDDRILADMGITRGDISDVVRGRFSA